MIVRYFLVMLSLLPTYSLFAQTELPIVEFPAAKSTKNMILYVCGDGGMNLFSKSLCSSLQNKGYFVAALDSRSYFWKRKSPAEAASDLSKYVDQKSEEGMSQVVIIGYSFGADVLPFIFNASPGSLKTNTKHVFLISPSTSTDMEIHLADMIGAGKKRSMDVIAELNKMASVPVHAIFADEDNSFPLSSVQLRTFSYTIDAGGHHFNGDTKSLTEIITAHL